MLEAYLVMGSTEIINNARVFGYMQSSGCAGGVFKEPECTTLAEALQESYEYASIVEAPWYDPAQPELSQRFYGVYATEISGTNEPNRKVTSIDTIAAGQVFTKASRGGRVLRAQVMLVAADEEAMDFGIAWLTKALDPGNCQGNPDCELNDVYFLSDCPPSRDEIIKHEAGPVLAHNWLPNPDFVATDGTVEVLRNRAIAPMPDTTWNYMSWGIGGAGFIEYGPYGPEGLTMVKYEWSAAPSTTLTLQATINLNSGQYVPVVAGMPLTVSVDAALTKAAKLGIRVNYYPSGGGSTTPYASGYIYDVSADPTNPTRISFTTPSAPSNAAYAIVHVTMETSYKPVPGDKLFLSRFLAVASYAEYRGDYFDGNGQATQDIDLTSSWTGVPNNSPSILTGKKIAGVSATSCIVIQSQKLGSGFSARMIATENAIGKITMTVPPEARGGARLRGTVTLSETRAVPDSARRMTVLEPTQTSAQAPNVPGSHPLELVYEPLTGVNLLQLAHNGTAGAADVFWSDLMLSEASYDGPIFTGNTAPTEEIGYRWAGAENASISESYTRISVQDPEAYQERLDALTRRMLDCVTTSGPIQKEQQPINGVKTRSFEFTIESSQAAVYGIETTPELIQSGTTVVEDDLKNLARNPRPGTTLSSYTNVLAVNRVSNPSFETNTTDWTAVAATITRVNSRARYGNYSLKIDVPASSTQDASVTINIPNFARSTDPQGFFAVLWIDFDEPAEQNMGGVTPFIEETNLGGGSRTTQLVPLDSSGKLFGVQGPGLSNPGTTGARAGIGLKFAMKHYARTVYLDAVGVIQ